MKIIRTDNYDREGPEGNQYVVAEGIKSEGNAKIMCDALNKHGGERSDAFFKVVPDDHVLPPDWEP